MKKSCTFAILLSVVAFFAGCKLTIFTFDAPDNAQTGTIITLTLTGEAKENNDGASKYGVVLQLPEDWFVISADANAGFPQPLIASSDFIPLYTPEAGNKIWIGTYSFPGSGDRTVSANIRIITGDFSGNYGDRKNFTIKAVAGVLRDGRWKTDDPVDIFDFHQITQDKYVEVISVEKIQDTISPSRVLENQIQLSYCGCNDKKISVDWTEYDEESEGDVVMYQVYYYGPCLYSPCTWNSQSVMAGTKTFSINNVTEGEVYSFKIAALDEAAFKEIPDESQYTDNIVTIKPETWDVGGDGRIGLEEAIRALQIVSGQH